jgi:hypothetical protein
MNHVVRVIGGYDTQQKSIGQEGLIYTPLTRERQAAAVKFLNENAFTTPTFFIKPEILRRIEPIGVIDRIKTAQRGVLNNLLSPSRLAHLVEQVTVDGKGYAPTDFLVDVRKGIWKELEGTEPVKVDAYRRNLQRAYIDLINDRLNRPASSAPAVQGMPAAASTDDVRPFFRGELKALSASVTAAMQRAADRATALHLEDIKDQIAKVLDPKIAPAAAAAPAGAQRTFDLFEEMLNPRSCWPDYRIKK